jgi:hypothetical protein
MNIPTDFITDEMILMALAALAWLFIKKWMDRAEGEWKDRLEIFTRGQDVRFDKIEHKIDSLIEGRMTFVMRSDLNDSLSRLHVRLDEMNDKIIDVAAKIANLEGKISDAERGR